MDEHQRRVWARMAESVDAYRAGRLRLQKLVQDLQGLMSAADLHDHALMEEFWNHHAPIYGELLVRTEDWAPPGSASDRDLDHALTEFREWVVEVLASTDDQRT